MPIYAYKCAACGFAKDVLRKMSDPLLTQCPSCQAESFEKQVTAAGFQLKGSGWYVTDFRDGGKSGGAKDGGSTDGGSKDGHSAAPTSKDAGGNSGSAASSSQSGASDSAPSSSGNSGNSGNGGGASTGASASAPSTPAATSPAVSTS